MVDQAKKMADFIKDRAKMVIEPLSKAEKAIETAGKKVTYNVEKLDAKEVKRMLDELKGRVTTARGEVEKFFNTGLEKTITKLNLATRDEIKALKTDVSKLTKDLKTLQARVVPVKKAAPKKTAGKSGR